MNVRFIVQAIERRAENVAYLQRHIPDLEVCWDNSGKCIGGFMKVLAQAGASSFVLLEDDIILTQLFVPKILYAIQQKPDCLIQFHSRSKDDLAVGSRFRAGRQFLNHQCVYFPTGMAMEILRFSEREIYHDFSSPRSFSDCLTQDYLHSNNLKYWTHIPSLVDHLPAVSMVDPRRAKTGIRRQARVFMDPETDGCPSSLLSKWKPLQNS